MSKCCVLGAQIKYLVAKWEETDVHNKTCYDQSLGQRRFLFYLILLKAQDVESKFYNSIKYT